MLLFCLGYPALHCREVPCLTVEALHQYQVPLCLLVVVPAHILAVNPEVILIRQFLKTSLSADLCNIGCRSSRLRSLTKESGDALRSPTDNVMLLDPHPPTQQEVKRVCNTN